MPNRVMEILPSFFSLKMFSFKQVSALVRFVITNVFRGTDLIRISITNYNLNLTI